MANRFFFDLLVVPKNRFIAHQISCTASSSPHPKSQTGFHPLMAVLLFLHTFKLIPLALQHLQRWTAPGRKAVGKPYGLKSKQPS